MPIQPAAVSLAAASGDSTMTWKARRIAGVLRSASPSWLAARPVTASTRQLSTPSSRAAAAASRAS